VIGGCRSRVFSCFDRYRWDPSRVCPSPLGPSKTGHRGPMASTRFSAKLDVIAGGRPPTFVFALHSACAGCGARMGTHWRQFWYRRWQRHSNSLVPDWPKQGRMNRAPSLCLSCLANMFCASMRTSTCPKLATPDCGGGTGGTPSGHTARSSSTGKV